MRSLFGVVLALQLGLSALSAELTLPNFFGDHMVLQQGQPVPIWGWADANADVSVSFDGKTTSAKADENGYWEVDLPKMGVKAEGSKLTVKAGDEEKVIDDVLVGEVWVASGQSNMVFTVDRIPTAQADVDAADYPNLRMFLADLTPASEPQENIGGEWFVCSPSTVGSFSAVAFYFARKLHEELGVPVGVLKSAWGGKPVETFTSREALETTELGKSLLSSMDASTANYDKAKAEERFEAALAQWNKKMDAWRTEISKLSREEREKMPRTEIRPPKKPVLAMPANQTEGNPSVLYNGMIHPFVGYGMTGAIWYQGEGNAKPGRAPYYEEMFSTKIKDWRERWGDDFSYYFVQLANFKTPSTEPGQPDLWALVQDEQRETLKLPHTGMAVANDVGEEKDIHPKDKKTVGTRLALWALARDYGKDIVYSGPLYSGSKVEGSEVRISFDHVGGGLAARDGGPLQRFEIAGEDKVWHWADAKIDGDSVVVSSSEVPKPVAVRYAWAANPQGANLINKEGLPASVFRTDDWEIEGAK